MAISYRKLWHLMLDKKINKSGLEKAAGISHHSILKMNRDEDVSTEVLTKICKVLIQKCRILLIFFRMRKNEHASE